VIMIDVMCVIVDVPVLLLLSFCLVVDFIFVFALIVVQQTAPSSGWDNDDLDDL
jgi:hypothetical protein